MIWVGIKRKGFIMGFDVEINQGFLSVEGF
jgi:hypothetical protein